MENRTKTPLINHPEQLITANTTISDDYDADIERISQALVDTGQKHIDLTELANAKFQSDAGCEVTVTRRYDHIGVHDRSDTCAWCLQRCGENVPYTKAVAMGMFERHAGCGCVITYQCRKGVFRQGRGDWQNNSWNDVSKSERQRRIAFSNRDLSSINVASVKTQDHRTRVLSKQLPFEYNGDVSFIPEGAEITNVKTMAGRNSDNELKTAKFLANKYGRRPEEWSKNVRKIVSDKYIFDIHWSERNGKVFDEKIKTMKWKKK